MVGVACGKGITVYPLNVIVNTPLEKLKFPLTSSALSVLLCTSQVEPLYRTLA
jgi:hypothetical protein